MADIIDAHHHLWRYDPREYSWITPELTLLQKDFLPTDLADAMRGARVDASIVVQARQSVEETDWLLSIAEGSNDILGVVGWLPVADIDFPNLLRRYARRPLLKALRHVIQDEHDPAFILAENFNTGITLLRDTGLVYDILIYAHQLPQTIEFVTRHPDQAFVLDHCGKPPIGNHSFEIWRKDIRDLGKRSNVACKLSGLATQIVGSTGGLEQLRPYLDEVCNAFGPKRLLAGSDWPVCLLATSYGEWWETLRTWATCLGDEDRADLFGGTAKRVYNLVER